MFQRKSELSVKVPVLRRGLNAHIFAKEDHSLKMTEHTEKKELHFLLYIPHHMCKGERLFSNKT